MSKSKIEWTDRVWNPVTGCTKVSPGCANCYAERMAKRLRGRAGYPADDPFKVTVHQLRLRQPYDWTKPSRIFVCSMGDLFHNEVNIPSLIKIFSVIATTLQHTYIILTKRPEKMRQFIIQHPRFQNLPNVWLGVSAENQQTANERIPILLQIPAAVRFVSCEPLLEDLDIKKYLKYHPDYMDTKLDWVIAGGESGPGARPMHPDWARSLRDQCQAAGVPFFFKQWGEWSPEFPRKNEEPTCIVCGCTESNACEGGCSWITEGMFEICSNCGRIKPYVWNDRLLSYKRGKKVAGRLLDGREYNEFPETSNQ